MRTRLSVLAVLAIGVMLVGVPIAAAAGGAHGASLVAGSGWRLAPGTLEPRVEFRVGAQIGPGKALGTYDWARTDGARISGTVTCGDVDSGVAVIGGPITSTTFPEFVGGYFYVFLIDDGSPTFGSLGPDAVSGTEVGGGSTGIPFGAVGSDFPGDFPAHCPAAHGETFDLAVAAFRGTVLGDVIVH